MFWNFFRNSTACKEYFALPQARLIGQKRRGETSGQKLCLGKSGTKCSIVLLFPNHCFRFLDPRFRCNTGKGKRLSPFFFPPTDFSCRRLFLPPFLFRGSNSQSKFSFSHFPDFHSANRRANKACWMKKKLKNPSEEEEY